MKHLILFASVLLMSRANHGRNGIGTALSRLAEPIRADLWDSLTGVQGTGRRAAGFEPAPAPSRSKP